ncbi:uracil phosphoribosyltransferase [Micractinium conductrix]|uniref:uracil phosphoribosyltransferase n=1 Tax=Micractinium conductrix TaxID=554055 RepID=A0A2P6V3S0_9CHLO|nr:uracil phosphoribosyltransferase [Micractinium conductrix]|eukprot:PSC68742.1 uracil phosphoribosyltransferase [Micractinium conductrix]
MRNKDTPSAIFRSAAAELGRILIYEAAREWLPTIKGQVQTPLGISDATFVDPMQPIKVVPILRAGLVLLEQAAMLLPVTQTFHVGYVRNDDTLEASCYLNKLPPRFSPDDRVLVSDVILATGGTLVQVVDELVARGARTENMRVISILCAPPALKVLGEKYPGLTVYTAMIDAELDARGYIVPGLGDAGDRAFNSL